ncbi:hypothetical protein PVIIG_06052 [Plasmodium vivax India VII]|uniref:VIR protein n=1 Tax=Plasmodium vivax India VII TaxID=1077284 RepID=A0A0J9SK97_PLAVI|nr:hypothetical protein PVIIG_06052 [Plasmodium vivax India VII]
MYSVFSSFGNIQDTHDNSCNYLQKADHHNNCNIYFFCKSVISIFSALYSMFNYEYIDINIDVCKHLNYWIYDKIKDNIEYHDVESLYEVLNSNKLFYLQKYHKCSTEDFVKVEGEFNIKNALFLHSEILHWIKESKDKMNASESNSYDKYFGECFKLYKEIKCSDNPSIKEKYNIELTKFLSNFNSAMSSLNDKGIKPLKKGITLSDESICKLEWENIQENIEGEIISRVEAVSTQEGDQGAIDKGPTRSPGLLEPAGAPGHLGLEEMNSPKDRSSIKTDNVHGDVNADTLTEKMANQVGTIGATVAGSSLFLLMMYKYTPLGSWVSTKILGRNKLMENMKKNNYELLLNDVANRDASLNNPMYHISYNSATNH